MSNEFSFENLEVYQRGLRFSLEICKLASNFPYKYNRLRDQLIGAVISFPLNIAEGNGRNTIKDKVNFYRIARASLFECIPILTICSNLNLVDNSTLLKYKQEALELSRMTMGLMKKTK